MRSWIKAQPEGEEHGRGTGTRIAGKEELKLYGAPWRRDGNDNADLVGEGKGKCTFRNITSA